MSKNDRKMSKFVWNETKLLACEAIARNENREQIAVRLGIADRTVRRWQEHPDFQLKISKIILEIDITQKSERIKIAKAVIEKKIKAAKDSDEDVSDKDLLEWLKYVGTEMGDYSPSKKITLDGDINTHNETVVLYLPDNGRDNMKVIDAEA